jgi:hypothetical protein
MNEIDRLWDKEAIKYDIEKIPVEIMFKENFRQAMLEYGKDLREVFNNPSEKVISNLCMSFRHDYGLMLDEEKHNLEFDCKEWCRSIYNNWNNAITILTTKLEEQSNEQD